MSAARLLEITLAATDVDAMTRFYASVLDIDLRPVEAAGTTLYEGRLDDFLLRLCPNEVAGARAETNRHQLHLAVPDVARALSRARASGGTMLGEATAASGAVRDPDGNSLVFVASS